MAIEEGEILTNNSIFSSEYFVVMNKAIMFESEHKELMILAQTSNLDDDQVGFIREIDTKDDTTRGSVSKYLTLNLSSII